ncbi:V0 assembly protein 1 [Lachancea thermotolerans]
MLLKSLFLFLAALFQACAAETSFLSVNSRRYRDALGDDQVGSLEELTKISDAEEPMVWFKFDKFDLLGELAQSTAETRFLTAFFEGSVTDVLDQDSSSKAAENVRSEKFEVAEIPASAFESLYDRVHPSDGALVFEFTESNYDLALLDEYLEAVYIYLEETLANIDNLAFQVPTSGKNYARAHSKVEVTDPEKKPGSSTDGVQSALWTEGLISCLIVAALLLWILVIAISWITSLDISYGALEKPANPLKKTN